MSTAYYIIFRQFLQIIRFWYINNYYYNLQIIIAIRLGMGVYRHYLLSLLSWIFILGTYLNFNYSETILVWISIYTVAFSKKSSY